MPLYTYVNLYISCLPHFCNKKLEYISSCISLTCIIPFQNKIKGVEFNFPQSWLFSQLYQSGQFQYGEKQPKLLKRLAHLRQSNRQTFSQQDLSEWNLNLGCMRQSDLYQHSVTNIIYIFPCKQMALIYVNELVQIHYPYIVPWC